MTELDDENALFNPEESHGYLVRTAHRAFQRELEARIAPYGVSRGQWYFLRILWEEDGLTQRELSDAVGMMEPTTVIAIRSLEKSGFVRRVRNEKDRRKINIFLTDQAKELRGVLLPLAMQVNAAAMDGLSPEHLSLFKDLLRHMSRNLNALKRDGSVPEAADADAISPLNTGSGAED
jgi:DNA-binding MarR family transcriptional regulator